MPLVFLGRGPPLFSSYAPLFLGSGTRLETPGANGGPGHHERNLAPTTKHNHFIPLTITRNLLGRALTVAATIASSLPLLHARSLPLSSPLPVVLRLAQQRGTGLNKLNGTVCS